MKRKRLIAATLPPTAGAKDRYLTHQTLCSLHYPATSNTYGRAVLKNRVVTRLILNPPALSLWE